MAVRGDTVSESTETFRVVLSSPTGATIASGVGTGTITDNDLPSASAAVTFSKAQNWGSGFLISAKIKNTTPTAINGWQVEFDLDAEIGRIWNGVVISHVGTHYVVQMTPSNARIAAGGEVSFGFIATGKGRTPTNVKFYEVAP